MEGRRRPERSDSHVSKEEEERIQAQTRKYFEEGSPLRHSKPLRSDYSSLYFDAHHSTTVIPEYAAFQRLQHDDPQKLEYNGSEVAEEFLETEYYKDLNCVDKQHHTTGTGFIKTENGNVKDYGLAADDNTIHHASSKCNPATNDWIPAAYDQVSLDSVKPNRSENY